MNMYNREDGTMYIIVYRSALKDQTDFINLCKALDLPTNCWKIEIDITRYSAVGYFEDKKKETTYENHCN